MDSAARSPEVISDPIRTIVLVAVIVKGTVISTILSVTSTPLLNAIVIAAVSATITGIFAFLAAYFTARYTRAQLQKPLNAIQGKLGADQRFDDDPTAAARRDEPA